MESITPIKIVSYLLILAGIIIKYIIRRRRFNRRAVTGLELFSSFEASWIIRLVEGVFNLIATFLILGSIGILVLINKYY